MLWETLRLHRGYTGTEKGAAEHPIHLRCESRTRAQAKPIQAPRQESRLCRMILCAPYKLNSPADAGLMNAHARSQR